MKMEVAYFCYCGKVNFASKWIETSRALWNYYNTLMAQARLEIRIIPWGCEQCQKHKTKGTPPKIMIGGTNE